MKTKLQWKKVDPFVLFVELTITYLGKIAWLFTILSLYDAFLFVYKVFVHNIILL